MAQHFNAFKQPVKKGENMTSRLFEVTINGATLTEIHDSALANLIRVYNPAGSVYVSRDDLDNFAWEATMTVYEKREQYVREDKNVCGLACRIAYNDLMNHLNKSMKKNMRSVPMEQINSDKGYYNTADVETGRKFTNTGIGVDREFDISVGEGLTIIGEELDRLSELDRKIFELYLDEVPQKEIAVKCGISYVNVRKRIFDIRKRLLRNKYIFTKVHDMGLVA